jgi:DNA-binding transcriptional LysR family regulator
MSPLEDRVRCDAVKRSLANGSLSRDHSRNGRCRCIRFRFLSGALYRWELERRGSSASINVDGPMTLVNTNLMVDAALAGIGIARVPEHRGCQDADA